MMKSALKFLLVARRCEIDELELLARTCRLVATIAQFVHALQRERGLSNVLIASGGARFGPQRLVQIAESLRHEREVRLAFDELVSQPRRVGNGTRLFSRIAAVVPGLEALATLRPRVEALEVDLNFLTSAYAKLISGLLAVVFEAADGATNPQISRRLAALFHFMQGKEYAGQERARGGAAFAAGRMDADRRRQWLALIAAQDRCFQIFRDFAGDPLATEWGRLQPDPERADLERMRRIACASDDVVLDHAMLTPWFDTSSLRIDAMHVIEERLTEDLQGQCMAKITEARAAAQADQLVYDSLPAEATDPSGYFDQLGDAALGWTRLPTSPPMSHQLERSVFDLLDEQTRRVQSVTDELESVRAALNERKLVERAKGLLMARRRVGEDEAHRMLRQTAMKQNRRLVEVAESVLLMVDVLPDSA